MKHKTDIVRSIIDDLKNLRFHEDKTYWANIIKTRMIFNHLDTSQPYFLVRNLINLFFQKVEDILKQNEDITLTNFAKIHFVKSSQRTVRLLPNQTGTKTTGTTHIPAYLVPRVKISRRLRNKLRKEI
jgi:nucleoid DNA-binding protein